MAPQPAKSSFFSSLLSEARTPDTPGRTSTSAAAMSRAVEKQPLEPEKIATLEKREADLNKRAKDLAERERQLHLQNKAHYDNSQQLAQAQANLEHHKKAQDAREKWLKARDEQENKNNTALNEEIERSKRREEEWTAKFTNMQEMVRKVLDQQAADKKARANAERVLETRTKALNEAEKALEAREHDIEKRMADMGEEVKRMKEQKEELKSIVQDAVEKEHTLEEEIERLKEKELTVTAKAESLAKEAEKLATEKASNDKTEVVQKRGYEYQYIASSALESGALVLCQDKQSCDDDDDDEEEEEDDDDDQSLSAGITSEISSVLRKDGKVSEEQATEHAAKLTSMLLFQAQVAKLNSTISHNAQGTMQLILSNFSNEILGNGLFAKRAAWTDIDLVDGLYGQVLQAPDLQALQKLEARASRAEEYFDSLRDEKVPLTVEEFLDNVKDCGEYAEALQELRWVIGEGLPAKKALTSFLMSVCKDLGVVIQHAAIRMGFTE
ncbi:predicted protein [Plenodomus lingam JN3]|uniref:Predicted protein n=1 Tax=Leptosphaeria maculans (strain JN3 / isolate v23.1.3 / race Av1-4-5-6-7-8) TaxID=985895 RepID=E4ZSI1_LEPMJ|nr:predicted protein [Plenodomus lingam JN3]CBX94361.1 predicted protein [Plenodomus lingam JN3]